MTVRESQWQPSHRNIGNSITIGNTLSVEILVQPSSFISTITFCYFLQSTGALTASRQPDIVLSRAIFDCINILRDMAEIESCLYSSFFEISIRDLGIKPSGLLTESVSSGLSSQLHFLDGRPRYSAYQIFDVRMTLGRLKVFRPEQLKHMHNGCT